jgi:hypothetical protein
MHVLSWSKKLVLALQSHSLLPAAPTDRSFSGRFTLGRRKDDNFLQRNRLVKQFRAPPTRRCSRFLIDPKPTNPGTFRPRRFPSTKSIIYSDVPLMLPNRVVKRRVFLKLQNKKARYLILIYPAPDKTRKRDVSCCTTKNERLTPNPAATSEPTNR